MSLEREEQYLEDLLTGGEITITEFNFEMRELQRDYQAAAEQAGQDAYAREMECW